MQVQIQKVYDAVLAGDLANIETEVDSALRSGLSAEIILNQGLITAMDEVGRRYEVGKYFVPEMLISARAMKAGLGFLNPFLVESGVEPVAKVAIGTVKGDLHDIGKNLIAIMLEGAGFETKDLGVDVPIEKFVDAAERGADILGLSALLTTTMPQMPLVIEALQDAGCRDKVKVIIGGAPVTQAYADQIGADGFAADASSVAPMARLLIPEKVD